MYFMGEEFAQDNKERARWIRKEAVKGHAEAQCLLGIMYRDGNVGPRDLEEAAQWFQKAAHQELGHGKAQRLFEMTFSHYCRQQICQNGFPATPDSKGVVSSNETSASQCHYVAAAVRTG
jgi:TPR repeat protein